MTEHAAEQTPPPQAPNPAVPAAGSPPAASTPGTDLARHPEGDLNARIRYARELSTAGDLIPAGLRNGREPSPGKVLLAIETGNMLGIHPVAAINGVNIIDGKATLSPALMSAVVRRAGHRLRVSMTGTIEAGDITATAELTRQDDPEFTYRATWTPHRASRAGLCTYVQDKGRWQVKARSKSGNALPWEAYTEALLKARAIGEVCREGAEDALMGVHYTPEELGAAVDVEGNPTGAAVETLAAPPVEEPDELAVAGQAIERALACTEVPGLVGVWNALPAVVARHSWARQYADLMDYARATVVPHPYDGGDATMSLFDAFGIIRKRLEGGPTEPPAADPEPDPAPPAPAPVYAPQDTSEPVEAEVLADPADDPWRDGGAMGEPVTHDGAVHAATGILGGQVVDDTAATPADRQRAAHEAAVERARAEREAAADKGAPTGPPEPGTNRAAAIAEAHAATERAKAKRQAEERTR